MTPGGSWHSKAFSASVHPPCAANLRIGCVRECPRKLRRQNECRNRIGTRRISDRDCRWDSSRPHLLTARTHAGVVTVTCTEEAPTPDGTTVKHTPLVGASALHGVSGTSSRSHLGSTLVSGKSCPDPGRLSTFGVSGLYPCRRLTYRGACETHGRTETHCSSNGIYAIITGAQPLQASRDRRHAR